MDFEVYCDESGHEHLKSSPAGEHFVLIGSIWAKVDDRGGLKQRIEQLRRRHGIHGAVRWGRVSQRELPFFRALVDLFFTSELRFRVMVMPFDELDAMVHDNSVELMLTRFYCSMLRGWLEDLHAYRVFTDVRRNRERSWLTGLERLLRDAAPTSSLSVQAVPSQDSKLMQAAGVLTGAVGYKYNKLASSPAKLELLLHIEEHLGRPIGATAPSEPKFNVLCIEPGGDW